MYEQPNHPAGKGANGSMPSANQVNRPANNARVSSPGVVLSQTYISDGSAEDFLGLGDEMGAPPALPQAHVQPAAHSESASWLMESPAEEPLQVSMGQGQANDPSAYEAANSASSWTNQIPSAAYPDQTLEYEDSASNEQASDDDSTQSNQEELQAQEQADSEDLRDVIIEEPVVPTDVGASWSEPRKPTRKVGKYAAFAGVFGIACVVGIGGFVSLKGKRLADQELTALSPEQHPLPSRAPGNLVATGNAWERHTVNPDGSPGALVASEPIVAASAPAPRSAASSIRPAQSSIVLRDPFPSTAVLHTNYEPEDDAQWAHTANHRRQLEAVQVPTPTPPVKSQVEPEMPSVAQAEPAMPSVAQVPEPTEPVDSYVPESTSVALSSEEPSQDQTLDPSLGIATTEPEPIQEQFDREAALALDDAGGTPQATEVTAEAAPPSDPPALPALSQGSLVGPPELVQTQASTEASFGPPLPAGMSATPERAFAGVNTTRVSRLSVEDVMLLNESATVLVQSASPNVWSATTIPVHLVDRGQSVATPNVGKVRLTLQSGDSFEGRLVSVGEGQAFVETSAGKLGFPAASIQGLISLESHSASTQKPGHAPEYVRMIGSKGEVSGRVVHRTETEVTFETPQGSRVTVSNSKVEPLVSAPLIEVKDPR